MKIIEKCLESCGHETAGILKAAALAALKGGDLIMERYEKPHQIRLKGAIDLATEADIASEKAILSILEQRYPGATVLAEESKADYEKIPEGEVWIIDPLDGTTNFAHGFPYFGVSIAYSVDRKSKMGVIYSPVHNELFCAWQGGGAWMNGKRIAVSREDKLIQSLVATGFPYDIGKHLDLVVGQVSRILPRVRDVRWAGAAALDLAYVACGRLDGFWEMNLKPWDTAAGQLLVEEAGGVVTDYRGGDFSPYFPEILASNSHIHQLLADLL
ncbi:MAG: inositol monophosphatase family protein [Thermodesulfobacteriota bacterium]